MQPKDHNQQSNTSYTSEDKTSIDTQEMHKITTDVVQNNNQLMRDVQLQARRVSINIKNKQDATAIIKQNRQSRKSSIINDLKMNIKQKWKSEDMKSHQYNKIKEQRKTMMKDRVNKIQDEVKRIIENIDGKSNQGRPNGNRKKSQFISKLLSMSNIQKKRKSIHFNEDQFKNNILDQYVNDKVSEKQYLDSFNFPLTNFMRENNICQSDRVLVKKTQEKIYDKEEKRKILTEQRINFLKKKVWDRINIKKQFRNEIENEYNVKLIEKDQNLMERNFEMMRHFLSKQIKNKDLLNQNPNTNYYQDIGEKKKLRL